jgi:hypothetical protein
MPQLNPFIPTDFDLRPEPAGPAVPALVPAADGGGEAGGGEGGEGGEAAARGLSLFHRAELRFKAPKAVVYLDFQVLGGPGIRVWGFGFRV